LRINRLVVVHGVRCRRATAVSLVYIPMNDPQEIISRMEREFHRRRGAGRFIECSQPHEQFAPVERLVNGPNADHKPLCDPTQSAGALD
jgi:hypothetical protein